MLADVGGAFRLFYDQTKGVPGVLLLAKTADPKAAAAMQALVARAPALAATGAEIFAAIEGAPEAVAALAKDAPFPVFVDAEGKVNAVYPVAGEGGGRKTVVIDPNQRVLAVFADADPAAETERALQFVRTN